VYDVEEPNWLGLECGEHLVLGRVAVEWIGVCCGCVRARLMEWVELWECW